MPTISSSSLWKKGVLIALMLVALCLLKDDTTGGLAVWVALRRHPPSMRVFRALSEVSLLLIALGISLIVWGMAVSQKVTAELLFMPPEDQTMPKIPEKFSYRPVVAVDMDEEQDQDEVEQAPKTVLGAEEDAFNANYASDDEVLPPNGVNIPDPPNPLTVFGTALDLLLVVMITLFLFTLSSAEGGRYIDGMTTFQVIANVAAPVFPLLLFVVFVVLTAFPWRQRKEIWMILSFTIGAPFYEVTFRDGFIGDVLTSSVRPLQDLAFTAFYILSGLRGWWTQSYDIDEAARPVEHSWVVRTVVLPACMIYPLWWRFMQNLRQTFEKKRRWPYLGNAAKYFLAAQVATVGVFNPEFKSSPLWLSSAVLATLYQVWWDIFKDWELLEMDGNGTVKLRQNRLYDSNAMYWCILFVNFVLRFGWTMTFFPKQFLNQNGALVKTFEGTFGFLDSFLASAEIIRRMMWGFLRLELEAIKTCSDDPKIRIKLNTASTLAESNGHIELEPMQMKEKGGYKMDFFGPTTGTRLPVKIDNDISTRTDLQVLSELCCWAAVFIMGAILAGAHRGTF